MGVSLDDAEMQKWGNCGLCGVCDAVYRKGKGDRRAGMNAANLAFMAALVPA